jgi:hypothetical protein
VKRKNIILFILSFLFFLNYSLLAQPESRETDEYIPDFESDEDMKPLKVVSKPFIISYGGWITSSIINSKSGNDATGTTEIMSSSSVAKLWFKTTLPYNSQIYLRGRDIFSYYIEKPEGSDLDDTENDIDLDVGYYYISLRDNTINFFAGRKFFLLGTGLLFNGRADGGEFNFFSRYVDVKIFGAYTGLLSEDTNPYRLSSRDISDEGKRMFIGGSISKSFYNQTVYLMALYQMDKNDDIDEDAYPDAKAEYNSQYYGLGLNGIFKDAFYYGEFIVERGESYTDYITASNEKQDINAMAAIVGINYYFDIKLRPVLLIDYAYGSGDSDKNYTSSATGNVSGKDKGFIYSGTYSGGYGLRPYLSNIHVYRAGVAFSPLYDLDNILFKRINLIAKYSNYQKDVSNSPINENEAINSKKDIGHGIDIAIKWKIFSDFSVFGNYGIFIPGSAYDSGEKNRTFVLAGIYLSF